MRALLDGAAAALFQHWAAAAAQLRPDRGRTRTQYPYIDDEADPAGPAP